MKGFVIALDGPAGAGKGTLAPLLAKELGGFYLYTGAFYRALAYVCLRKKIEPTDEKEVLREAESLKLILKQKKIFLAGQEITASINNNEIARLSSQVALLAKVRWSLVNKQQQLAQEYLQKGKIVVAEGRDSATRIFPDARFKIFLTASREERARRRFRQLQKTDHVSFKDVFKSLKTRDKQDIERKTDPLVSDPLKHGYVIVDNTNLDEEETLDALLKIINLPKKQ